MATAEQQELFNKVKGCDFLGAKNFIESNVGIDLNFQIEGTTLLHQAVANIGTGMVELLLQYGINPDIQDEYGYTAFDRVEEAIGYDDLAPEQFQDIVSMLYANHAPTAALAGLETVIGYGC